MDPKNPVENQLELTDFRLAGFLVARNVPFKGTMVNAKQEVVFLFGEGAECMLAQYPGSPEWRYDSACRTMHDLVKLALKLGQKRLRWAMGLL